MLRQSTLNQALTLASQKPIVAKQNSVLNELVALSIPALQVELTTEEQLQYLFEQTEASISTKEGELSPHSLQQDGLIKDLSALVRRHIDFAKNTVKPLVVEMAEAIQAYHDQYKPKLASQSFNIEIMHLPELLQDESFLDTLKPYVGKTIIKPDVRLVLPTKTTDELISLIKIGIERLDKLVLEWLSAKTDNFLVEVYNTFFTKEPSISSKDLETHSIFSRIDIALAALLLCHRLYEEVPEGSNMDLQTYKVGVMQLRDYVGSVLTKDLESKAMYDRTERLIIDSSLNRQSIRVNGIVYKSWLQAGGQPEVILGYAISGDTITSKVAIDSKSKEYLSQWTSYELFYNTNESNKALDYCRDFLLQLSVSSMKELSQDEIAYSQKTTSYFNTIETLNKEYVNTLRRDDLVNVYDIALTIVAKHRFYYTSAYKILNDINEASKHNKDIDVREAALVAVIHYLSDYFANQMTVYNG